jgi:DNA-binding NarL/FixJ family response regulator
VDAARCVLQREGITVVGVASTAAEAVQCARELQPNVTLVDIDIDLGGESGFDVARRLHEDTGVDPSRVATGCGAAWWFTRSTAPWTEPVGAVLPATG